MDYKISEGSADRTDCTTNERTDSQHMQSEYCKERKTFMKLIHLSDLHLGKRVNEFSMIQDQDYILKQILRLIDGQSPDEIFTINQFLQQRQ